MRVNKDLSSPDISYDKRWPIVSRVCGRWKLLVYSTHCSKRSTHFWFRGKNAHFNENLVLQTKLPVANAIPSIIQPHQTKQFLSSLLQKSKCLNWWRVLTSLRHVGMMGLAIMGLVIRILNYAVRAFMFILLLVLICIIQLVITWTNENLQIIYLRWQPWA